MMFAAALVLTALVCLFFAAVPAYLFRRGLERRDFVPGIAVFAAVWLWGICFFSSSSTWTPPDADLPRFSI